VPIWKKHYLRQWKSKTNSWQPLINYQVRRQDHRPLKKGNGRKNVFSVSLFIIQYSLYQ
jgi:hypothetical protein